MSLIPLRSSEIDTLFDCSKSSILTNAESWKTSTLVLSPMLTSGVSLNFLIEAPSIFSTVPASCSRGTHERKEMVPLESPNLPRKTSNWPLPSRLTITSGLDEISRATRLTKPSLCEASAIEEGSSLICTAAAPPSLRTVTRVVLLMLRERLSFHSFTDAPSRRTMEPGARFSAFSPQSLKSQRSR